MPLILVNPSELEEEQWCRPAHMGAQRPAHTVVRPYTHQMRQYLECARHERAQAQRRNALAARVMMVEAARREAAFAQQVQLRQKREYERRQAQARAQAQREERIRRLELERVRQLQIQRARQLEKQKQRQRLLAQQARRQRELEQEHPSRWARDPIFDFFNFDADLGGGLWPTAPAQRDDEPMGLGLIRAFFAPAPASGNKHLSFVDQDEDQDPTYSAGEEQEEEVSPSCSRPVHQGSHAAHGHGAPILERSNKSDAEPAREPDLASTKATTELAKPAAEPSGPATESTEPTEPTEPAEPTEPTESTEPSEPSEPATELTKPTTEPSEPDTPARTSTGEGPADRRVLLLHPFTSALSRDSGSVDASAIEVRVRAGQQGEEVTVSGLWPVGARRRRAQQARVRDVDEQGQEILLPQDASGSDGSEVDGCDADAPCPDRQGERTVVLPAGVRGEDVRADLTDDGFVLWTSK